MKKFFSITGLFFFISHSLLAQDRSLCGLTEKDMIAVNIQVKENIEKLIGIGKLDTSTWEKSSGKLKTVSQNGMVQNAVPTSIRFAWPMRPSKPVPYEYYHIGNYIDLDSTGNECVRDYMGGFRTYDGHQGTDIGIGPYWWKAQFEGAVYAVAAAPGVIVEKVDGRKDDQCGWNNGDTVTRGNHIVILHNDGQTVSYYMHMKMGSLTELQVGDEVKTGTILGTVASSGNSTGPHLHFQVNVGWSHPTEGKGTKVDPWAGPSNYTTSASLWLNQKPYDDPGIYAMETLLGTNHDWYDPTDFCDKTIDLSNLKNSFSPGNTVGLYTTFRDWVDGSKLSAGLRKPDGSSHLIWLNITNTCQQKMQTCKLNYTYISCRLKVFEQSFTVPADAPSGTWDYWVSFNGTTYHKYFSVGCLANQTVSGTLTGSKGYRVSNNLTSTAIIGSATTDKVEYHADNAVILSPGFTATQGCTFRATNYGCSKVE